MWLSFVKHTYRLKVPTEPEDLEAATQDTEPDADSETENNEEVIIKLDYIELWLWFMSRYDNYYSTLVKANNWNKNKL